MLNVSFTFKNVPLTFQRRCKGDNKNFKRNLTGENISTNYKSV